MVIFYFSFVKFIVYKYWCSVIFWIFKINGSFVIMEIFVYIVIYECIVILVSDICLCISEWLFCYREIGYLVFFYILLLDF